MQNEVNMSAIDMHSAAIEQRFVNYEAEAETWLADHEAVRDCWAVEVYVQQWISSGRLIFRLRDSWNTIVFEGIMSENAALDDPIKKRGFCMWSTTTVKILNELVEPTERVSLLEVKRADELRALQYDFDEALRTWKPAKLAVAVGLREIKLDDESAAAIRAIEAKGAPPLPDMPRIPTVSAEQFFAGLKR